MNSKILKGIAVLVALIMVLNIPLLAFTIPVNASPEPEEYMNVSGVLDTDTYYLYPFKTDASLKIGFSKYGEMIDSQNNIGLEYRGVDPFAPPAGPSVPSAIPKKYWINGWLINITYDHVTFGKRNVWACALHADLNAYGGPWQIVSFPNDKDPIYGWEDPRDPPFGGRKTNGTAYTMDPIVLYNGPRRFVVFLATLVCDLTPAGDEVPLVWVIFTIDFNKVKKEVIVVKDVKSVMPWKITTGNMTVQFSNRGEVDLGTATAGFESYAYFGHDISTVYNKDYLAGVYPGHYDPQQKKIVYGDYVDGQYNVLQCINPAANAVFFAAFWPSLSQRTPDGFNQWWRSINEVDNKVNMATEPETPFYIGEWDFELENTGGKARQFRGVTVYGVVDKNNADDASIGSGHTDVLDKEARYQLNEVFNPWDLKDAVEKSTNRHVTYIPGPASGPIPLPGIINSVWDEYCSFAERVILEPDGILWVRGPDYTLTPGTGITLLKPVPLGKMLKILWSSSPAAPASGGAYEWIVVGRDSNPVDSIGAAMVSEAFDSLKEVSVEWAGFDLKNEAPPCDTVPYLLYKFGGTRGPLADVPLRVGYYYPWDTVPKLARTALRNDWSSTVPITTSNIISIGGSWANVVTEYFSEFTPVVGGAPVGIAWKGGFIPVPCWNHAWKTDQSETLTGGYAVISTYKDINGTVGFLVYGWNGEDTYWASTALYEAGIVVGNAVLDEDINAPLIKYLQGINDGVTAIIIGFDYTKTGPYSTDIHPVGVILEMLGTISEKNPHVDP
jgi:hypothetical protein